MAKFLQITKPQLSVPDKIIKIISFFILLSAMENTQRFIFSCSAIILGLLSSNLQASKSIFLFLPSFGRVPVKPIQKTSLPGPSTLFKNLSRKPVRRKDINVLGLRLICWISVYVWACEFSLAIHCARVSLKSLLRSSWVFKPTPQSKTMTLIYSIKQPLRSHNRKHSEALCSSWSYSRGGQVGFWLPTASLPRGRNCSPCPSVPRQTSPAAPPQAEAKHQPARAEVGVLPSHCSSGGQLTLSQFHTQTG